MNRDIQLHYSHSVWERFLDWNPQLFRELKGKLKTRNVIIAVAISVVIQFLCVINLLADLPDPDPQGKLGVQYGRYGLGHIYRDSGSMYHDKHLPYSKDLLDNWVINWQLLWLDLFMILSIISILALLIVGTYMLVADLTKEESRGTLNFIRLTPQSASNILLGKILGVPVLLYTVILLFLPLHTIAGINARIPLGLILGFDAAILASCAFFYSFALLCSLLNFNLAGFKPWLISGVVGCLLFVLTQTLLDGYLALNNPLGWLFLFNPSLVLTYLIDATHLPNSKIDFLPLENLQQLLFYGQAWWTKATVGIGLIIFNFSLWAYWSWSLLERRFHNPESTLFSKVQSYWLTGWLVAIDLGFTLQSNSQVTKSEYFIFLQLCLGVWGLSLIAALSPHRQKLHDWARYRHQTHKNNGIWQELVFGENSPSTVAVAINLAIAIAYITPSIFIHLDRDSHYVLWGFIISAASIMLCAVAAQMILMLKTRKRAALSIITVASMIIVPPVCFGMANIYWEEQPLAWLFSFIPTIAAEYVTMPTIALTLLGQWLAISGVGFLISRKLKQAGASETKMLLARTNVLNG